MATSKEILENQIPEKLKANPALLTEINSVIVFDITGEGGGKWTVDLTKPEGWVTAGAADNAKMTVSASNDDFAKIVAKQLNAQMAAMQGKLKFKPMDMGLAMKLAKLIG